MLPEYKRYALLACVVGVGVVGLPAIHLAVPGDDLKLCNMAPAIQARIARVNPELNPYYRRVLAESVLAAAGEEIVEPALLLAVIEKESTYKPGLRGGKGEAGVAQIMPHWINHTPYATNYEELRDTPTNVAAAAHILSVYLKQCGEADMLACYNAGPEKRRFGRDYAKDVLMRRDEIAKEVSCITIES